MKKNKEVYLSEETLDSLLKRLKRIEGHVRGIQKMLRDRKSCEDIILQLSAVESALRSVIVLLLKGHFETCVKFCALKQGEEKALDSLKNAILQAIRII